MMMMMNDKQIVVVVKENACIARLAKESRIFGFFLLLLGDTCLRPFLYFSIPVDIKFPFPTVATPEGEWERKRGYSTDSNC
jgi:hypothetical protein